MEKPQFMAPHFFSKSLIFLIMVLAVFPVPTVVPAEGENTKIYIPKDLEDAHRELEKMLKPEDIEKIKSGTEEDMNQYHFGLGMWMRNNWDLWKSGRLSKYFNELGIQHPDDMSGIILTTFWCKLNNKPYRLQERIKFYQAFWKAGQEPNEKSPIDGANIDWVISQHPEGFLDALGDKNADGLKGWTHLGISVTDQSFWRYEYGIGKIEPARPGEAKELAQWQADIKKRSFAPSGTTE
jgi:hypothetical protein